MQTFYNQAILSHNNVIRTSNIVTGIITDVVSATKNATKDSYTHGDEITYSVAIVNSGASAINDLVLTDDLGAYTFGTQTLVPLDYVDGSVLYYVNGVLQPSPTVSTAAGLSISPINLPANSNAVVIYTTTVNSYAPLGNLQSITNTATLSGDGIINNITATENVEASSTADLAIVKTLSPTTIYNNGQLTYTFTIQNYGAAAVELSEDAVISDTFNPILSNLVVTFNGVPWVLGTNYNYNETSGLFSSIAGNISVPAAIYSQDTASGVWTVTPGVSVITVTGNV